MKKNFAVALFTVFLLTILFAGCKKENSEFIDELKLGTGMIGFDLTGEATTFTMTQGSIILFFRLESKDDMAGRTRIMRKL